jgi:hypothetical protein
MIKIPVTLTTIKYTDADVGCFANYILMDRQQQQSSRTFTVNNDTATPIPVHQRQQ